MSDEKSKTIVIVSLADLLLAITVSASSKTANVKTAKKSTIHAPYPLGAS